MIASLVIAASLLGTVGEPPPAFDVTQTPLMAWAARTRGTIGGFGVSKLRTKLIRSQYGPVIEQALEDYDVVPRLLASRTLILALTSRPLFGTLPQP
jgi:hypothetical protein